MNMPLTTLLGFATWTLLVLMATIGVHRWTMIMSGRAQIHTFPADAPDGPGWYKRATRAHANCIENLPVYASIVLVLITVGVSGPMVDALCCVVLGARICQTSVHIAFEQSARVVSFRFSFFTIQLLSMLWLVLLIVARLAG